MVLSMDYEEKSFFRKRICEAAGEDNNWAVMMAVERLLTGACIAAKRRGMSGDYIQGLMQRIEMANYIGD